MSEFDLMSGGPVVAAEQCTARSKGTGQRCGRRVRGGGVCRYHGGRSPNATRAREARIATAEARALYADEHAVRDAGEVLVAAVADVDGIVQKLKQRIELSGELHAHDLDALGQWLDRAQRTAKAVLDARVDERRVKLDEQTGQLVALIIRTIFARLDLSPAQQAISGRVAAEVLRAAQDGPAAIEAAGRRR